MRWMGLDYGSRTVGVAVSDALGITAQPIETIVRKDENKLRRTYARIEELIDAYEVSQLVVGLPLHMNSDEGDRARLAREFGEALQRRTRLPVCFRDERLTTMQAERVLMDAGVRRENRKDTIDAMAAALILQSVLDEQAMKKDIRQPD